MGPKILLWLGWLACCALPWPRLAWAWHACLALARSSNNNSGGAAAAGRRRRPVVVAGPGQGKAGMTGPGQTRPRQGTTGKPAKPKHNLGSLSPPIAVQSCLAILRDKPHKPKHPWILIHAMLSFAEQRGRALSGTRMIQVQAHGLGPYSATPYNGNGYPWPGYPGYLRPPRQKNRGLFRQIWGY